MTLSEQIKSGFEELKGIFSKAPTLQASIDQLQADHEKAKAELATASAKAVQLEADLATSRQSISSLTTERDTARAELATATEKLANPGPAIKAAASAQAAAIVAQVGHDPLPATAPANPANPEKTELKGRARFLAGITIQGQ